MIKDFILDATKFERFTAAYREQLPFAIATALNRTGEDANAALRAHIEDKFTIRVPSLLRYVAPVQLPRPNRATKQNLTVILETDRIGRLFNPFEQGVPKSGSVERPLIVPSDALRLTKKTVIPRSLYPGNLGLTPKRDPAGTSYYALGRNSKKKKLTPFHTTGRGVTQVKGRRRTFVLDPRYNRNITPAQAGIYQRTGPGKHDIRLLWHFTERVQRPAVLEFYDTVDRTWDARIGPNFEGAMAFALRTAR